MRRENFAARFRLAAKYYIGFQKRLAKLGPQYLSCNERQTNCEGRKANPRKGCPDCKFTETTKEFHKELEEKLNRLPRTTRRGMRIWTEKKMYQTAQEIASVAGSVKNGTGRRWTVPIAFFVSIYRDELGKIKAIEAIKAQEELDRIRAEAQNK